MKSTSKRYPRIPMFHPLAFFLAALSLTACQSRQPQTRLMEEIGKQITGLTQDQKSTQTVSSQVPDGLPLPKRLEDRPEQRLHRLAYEVSYNSETKIPNWVMWSLTADHTNGPYKRGGIKFTEDTEVPEPRATDFDYVRSNYDRGHLCPSGDNKWNQTAQEQSFLMTNVCPQSHALNAGDWNEMEMQCRRWARRYGQIYIVAGPILYNQRHKRIGNNRVTVPEAFFKVVLRLTPEPAAIGFIYKNQSGNRPKGDYVNSVDQIERITGIDFFASLPDETENAVEREVSLEAWDL